MASTFDVTSSNPTGELVIVTFAIPLPVYKKISALARARGTTTNKFLMNGMSWFMTQINKAISIAENQTK